MEENKKRDSRIIGYTTGVFDLFHIGHLNLLRNAHSLCDKLIVGVTTDELLAEYKGKKSIIPFFERCEIVRSINYVDAVIAQHDMNKFEAWQKLKFDIMFVGDDWYNNEKWQKIEEQFAEVGVKIVYIPYTQGTSSTLVNRILVERRDELDRKKSKLRDFLEERADDLNLSKEDIEKML